MLRRVVPRCRFERDVVQDGRHPGLSERGATKARPVLLEPLLDVTVWTPGEILGDVMGDLSSRRGQILGTDTEGRLTRVKAIVPRGRDSTSTPPRSTRSRTAAAPSTRSTTATPRRRRKSRPRWPRRTSEIMARRSRSLINRVGGQTTRLASRGWEALDATATARYSRRATRVWAEASATLKSTNTIFYSRLQHSVTLVTFIF